MNPLPNEPVRAKVLGIAISVPLSWPRRPGDRLSGEIAPVRESAIGVRRAKAALSSGCKPHPATAPAGSNRSSYGGNEVAEAFRLACHEWVTARVCRPQRE